MKIKKNYFKTFPVAPAEVFQSRPSSHQSQGFLSPRCPAQQAPNLFTLQALVLHRSSQYSGFFQNVVEILPINKCSAEVRGVKIRRAGGT